MPRIFLYEFLTGGGLLGADWDWPPDSLLREGAAMAAAMAADWAAAGARVEILWDHRWAERYIEQPGGVAATLRSLIESRQSRFRVVRDAEDERAAFLELAAACDATVVIAPELSHALIERCRWVAAAGGRLLGPSLATVALASDKHATAEHLRHHGIPVPRGWLVEPGANVPAEVDYPAVGKPCLGAGSQGIQLLQNRQAAEVWAAGLQERSRMESFRPGMAASVAVLCGPAGVFPLVPCRQRLGTDGRFAYQGGSLPLEDRLARRAARLAVRAVAALPVARGYLGVDIVLGADANGNDDVVIEVNPRLTTSYVGLRAAAAPGTNLAAAILAVCDGNIPQLSFRPVAVQFEPDGTVRRSALDDRRTGRWDAANGY